MVEGYYVNGSSQGNWVAVLSPLIMYNCEIEPNWLLVLLNIPGCFFMVVRYCNMHLEWLITLDALNHCK